MARSDVDIANQALNMLGHESILNFSEDTEAANLAASLFETTRDEIFFCHPWNCLIERSSSMAHDLTGTTFGWTYSYTLPTNCLRVLYCDCVEDGFLWRIEGRKLVTNADTPLYIQYIKKEENVNVWSIYLYRLVIIRLAAKMALALTEDGTLARAMFDLYEREYKEARFLNASEGKYKTVDTDLFAQNRRGVLNPTAVY